MGSDLLLVQGLVSGDESAYTGIFDKYWKTVFEYMVKKTGDLYLAEDIVQDVFEQIWIRRHKISVHTNLKSYLFAAAKYNFFKKIDSHTVRLDDAYAVTLGTDSINPESQLEFEELYERLVESIERLPEKNRNIFKLSRFDHLTTAEISEKLNISPQTVSNRISGSLQLLRQDLNQFGSIILLICLH